MKERFRFLTGVFAGLLAAGALLAIAPAAFARTLNVGGAPMPGGVYTGKTSNGARVKITVARDGLQGTLSGTMKLTCAAGDASLQTSDGAFTATWPGSQATASGLFDINTVSGHVGKLSGTCGGASYTAKLTAPSGVRVKTIRYGPDALNPMSMDMPMPKSMFNMEGAMQDFWSRGISQPCSDCYIVGIQPNFVYPSGKVANYDTGSMMHHIVLFNDSARDVTCPGFPQRIMASGNERTDIMFPRGYGYYVGAGEDWSMLAELMNMSMRTQQVSPQLTYYYVPASAHLHAVTPMWLDENNCGDSLYSIPKGASDTAWRYTVPSTLAGKIVAIGGHQHDYGTHISLTDTTTHKLICDSRAGYGMNMSYMKNIESMTGCIGEPVDTIRAGDVLSLNSFYKSPIAENDVMGIMVAYVSPSGT